jgi:hypothetical protein
VGGEVKKLAIGVTIAFLVTACSAEQPRPCEWGDKRDADYNAAIEAIDAARSSNQQAINNYLASSRADLINVIHESDEQLRVARDKVIGAVGAAKLAASSCD